MSNPLLTEIMKFFYEKEENSSNEESLEELINDLQGNLEDCLMAEDRFRNAAYYNPFDRQQNGGINYADRKKINFKH